MFEVFPTKMVSNVLPRNEHNTNFKRHGRRARKSFLRDCEIERTANCELFSQLATQQNHPLTLPRLVSLSLAHIPFKQTTRSQPFHICLIAVNVTSAEYHSCPKYKEKQYPLLLHSREHPRFYPQNKGRSESRLFGIPKSATKEKQQSTCPALARKHQKLQPLNTFCPKI